jgi:hypothetical protein
MKTKTSRRADCKDRAKLRCQGRTVEPSVDSRHADTRSGQNVASKCQYGRSHVTMTRYARGGSVEPSKLNRMLAFERMVWQLRSRLFGEALSGKKEVAMDASRRRRASRNLAKRRWYSIYRSARFRRRFGWTPNCTTNEIADYCRRVLAGCDKGSPIDHSVPPVTCA